MQSFMTDYKYSYQVYVQMFVYVENYKCGDGTKF
jgi:hypothetical protein